METIWNNGLLSGMLAVALCAVTVLITALVFWRDLFLNPTKRFPVKRSASRSPAANRSPVKRGILAALLAWGVLLLLPHGAEVNARNNEGKTALTLATQDGDRLLVDLLSQHGGHD